jgi:hypothetical protein
MEIDSVEYTTKKDWDKNVNVKSWLIVKQIHTNSSGLKYIFCA